MKEGQCLWPAQTDGESAHRFQLHRRRRRQRLRWRRRWAARELALASSSCGRNALYLMDSVPHQRRPARCHTRRPQMDLRGTGAHKTLSKTALIIRVASTATIIMKPPQRRLRRRRRRGSHRRDRVTIGGIAVISGSARIAHSRRSAKKWRRAHERPRPPPPPDHLPRRPYSARTATTWRERQRKEAFH